MVGDVVQREMMKNAVNKKIHSVLLFLFCGIMGLVLIVFSSIMFVIIANVNNVPIRLIVLTVMALLLGICLALLGVNKLREWLYSLVLLAFPASLLVWYVFAGQIFDSVGPFGFITSLVLFVVLFPLLALNLVTKYYRACQRDTRRDRELETAQQSGASNPHSPSAQGADGR